MAYKVAVVAGTDATSQASSQHVCAELESRGHTVVVLPCDPDLTQRLRQEHPDVCYIAADNRTGRSGSIQSLLDLLEIPWVGSEAAVCRSAWNKDELAHVLAEAAVREDFDARTPYAEYLEASCFLELGAAAALDLLERRIPGGYPFVVQPARGTEARVVANTAELGEAIHAALGLDDTVIVREWIEGVHLSVGILGDADDLQVLPPVEVVRGERTVLDEELGIGDTTTDYFAPVRLASLSDDVAQAQAIRSEIERCALDAYLACGCRDLGCVDLIWDGARARVLAVDAAPAMGPGDLIPLACEAAQIPLADALDALVSIAVERGC